MDTELAAVKCTSTGTPWCPLNFTVNIYKAAATPNASKTD